MIQRYRLVNPAAEFPPDLLAALDAERGWQVYRVTIDHPRYGLKRHPVLARSQADAEQACQRLLHA
ncbi:hypothetical protein [Deinococcus sp. 12RED42]|uniref:hypothetical protein n=1 Tax=Deinococcus sp. 12RED42 TaxID=2745872 RepID=UPI001E545F6D|nr:hypothetical protein [Deinococcus sp. 12RED42]MCD0166353.1 hypothetical protein [Deinococcus sp. 12RED42]